MDNEDNVNTRSVVNFVLFLMHWTQPVPHTFCVQVVNISFFFMFKSESFSFQEEYRVKKAATSEGGACNSLTSAMALGSLVMYVRALLETDQAFQYDVLT